jgi:hypothetical protein
MKSCASDPTLLGVHALEFLQLNHEEKHFCHIWNTLKCRRLYLKGKGDIHFFLSSFEHSNAALFLAPIPTLNAFQTFGGKKW